MLSRTPRFCRRTGLGRRLCGRAHRRMCHRRLKLVFVPFSGYSGPARDIRCRFACCRLPERSYRCLAGLQVRGARHRLRRSRSSPQNCCFQTPYRACHGGANAKSLPIGSVSGPTRIRPLESIAIAEEGVSLRAAEVHGDYAIRSAAAEARVLRAVTGVAEAKCPFIVPATRMLLSFKTTTVAVLVQPLPRSVVLRQCRKRCPGCHSDPQCSEPRRLRGVRRRPAPCRPQR